MQRTLPNFSQSNITTRLAHFLRLRYNEYNELARFFTNDRGACGGLSIIFLYAAWLASQPRQSIAPRDDLESFSQTISTLIHWDLKLSSLNLQEQDELERLAQHIIYFQYTLKLINDINQGALAQQLIDSLGQAPQQEYTLAGIFTVEDLYCPLPTLAQHNKASTTSLLTCLTQENRLVYLRSHNHALGLIRQNNIIKFYDSNNRLQLWRNYSNNNIKELAHDIFHALSPYNEAIELPLAFRIFNFNEAAAHYPTQEAILGTIASRRPARLNTLTCGLTNLHIAVLGGSLESLQFNLMRNPNPNAFDDLGQSILHTALLNKEFDIAAYLIEAKITINAKSVFMGYTPLHIAVKLNQEKLVDLLLLAGANPNEKDDDGMTPLDYTKDRDTTSKLLHAMHFTQISHLLNSTLFSKNYQPIYSRDNDDTERENKRFRTN